MSDAGEGHEVDRRGFLQCMAWTGTGLLWSVVGGVPGSRALGATAAQAQGAAQSFSFVQISDTHIGFKGAANPDALGTFEAAIARIKALDPKPSFLIHTGDITHAQKAGAFDTVSEALKGTGVERTFYVPGEKVRRNITEGRPGTPLALKLKVVNVSTCAAIKGAMVDVWHCDAGGTYSGVQGSTGTFMRGIQPTDANGVATFQTVYPGWYQGRTVHVHVKVHLGGNVVHTGQLFFPDTLTDAVYKASAPYDTRAARDTRNANDSIYVNGGKRSLLALGQSGGGYVAAITMGVHR